jgi:hypothetical protein
MIVRTTSIAIIGVVAVVAIYYLVPGRDGEVGAVARFVVVVGASAALVVIQLRAVVRNRHPRLKALEAAALTTVVAVVGFATLHLELSRYDAEAYTEVLDKTDALYFTVTTLATVGYGDIAPSSSAARVATMLNMVANVLLIGAAVRVLWGVAGRAVATATPDTAPAATTPAVGGPTTPE